MPEPDIEKPAVIVRTAYQPDLPEIAAIQRATPEASQWDPASYLDPECAYACHVAVVDRRVVGFAVVRRNAPDERELLNIAIDPAHRRQGIARALLSVVLSASPAKASSQTFAPQTSSPQVEDRWFLEVRESNLPAQALYQSLGFERIGRRERYYANPPESAIVMHRKS